MANGRYPRSSAPVEAISESQDWGHIAHARTERRKTKGSRAKKADLGKRPPSYVPSFLSVYIHMPLLFALLLVSFAAKICAEKSVGRFLAKGKGGGEEREGTYFSSHYESRRDVLDFTNSSRGALAQFLDGENVLGAKRMVHERVWTASSSGGFRDTSDRLW